MLPNETLVNAGKINQNEQKFLLSVSFSTP